MKRNAVIDMTHGPLLGKILLFSLPLMASNILQLLFNAADIVVVGRFTGHTALAAVGSTGALINLLINVFIGLSIGTNVLVARYYGAQDAKQLSETVHTSVLTSLVSGVILIVMGVAFAEPLLTLMGTPEDVLGQAALYMRIYFVGMPAMMLYNFGAAILRSVGDTKRPLYFLLVASFLNIGLDLLCIIVFKMGVFGASFATVFSQAVAGFGSLWYIARHYHELRWSKEEGKLSRDHCLKLCNMGIPMGLQCSITAIGSVVLQGAVNGLGSDIVAAQTAGGKAAQFLCVPLESIGTAMTTYASQNMGAKDLDRVDRGVYTALGIGCVYSIASFLILRVTDKLLIGLFLDTSGVWCIGVPLAFLGALVWHLPIYGVYALVMSEEVYKLILGYIRYRQKKWLKNLAIQV